jgi:hypothetical protein
MERKNICEKKKFKRGWGGGEGGGGGGGGGGGSVAGSAFAKGKSYLSDSHPKFYTAEVCFTGTIPLFSNTYPLIYKI